MTYFALRSVIGFLSFLRGNSHSRPQSPRPLDQRSGSARARRYNEVYAESLDFDFEMGAFIIDSKTTKPPFLTISVKA